MSEQFAGLAGTCMAAGRITGFAEPAHATLDTHFSCSNPVRLGVGHYTVKLAVPCDKDRRAVTCSPSPSLLVPAPIICVEDLSLADDTTVAFYLSLLGNVNGIVTALPLDGTLSFDVTRTD